VSWGITMADLTAVDRHHNGPPAADRIEDAGTLITAKKQRGRPTLYTPETVDRICDRLADGESLKAICREPGMPSERTVLTWAATPFQGVYPAPCILDLIGRVEQAVRNSQHLMAYRLPAHYGASPQRNAAVLCFSAGTTLADSTQLYLRYGGEVGGGTDNHAFNVGVRMTW
jgi:hypothetical protein